MSAHGLGEYRLKKHFFRGNGLISLAMLLSVTIKRLLLLLWGTLGHKEKGLRRQIAYKRKAGWRQIRNAGGASAAKVPTVTKAKGF